MLIRYLSIAILFLLSVSAPALPIHGLISPEEFIREQKMSAEDARRFSEWILQRFGTAKPLECTFTTESHSGNYSTQEQEEKRVQDRGEFLFQYLDHRELSEKQTQLSVPTLSPATWDDFKVTLLYHWETYAKRGWKFTGGCITPEYLQNIGATKDEFDEFISNKGSAYSLELQKISYGNHCLNDRGKISQGHFGWDQVDRQVNYSYSYLGVQADCKPIVPPIPTSTPGPTPSTIVATPDPKTPCSSEMVITPKAISDENILDIVWVIDNSSSMKPYQDALSENLSDWVNGLVHQDIDFQIAVITTDGRVNSDLGGDKALNSATFRKNPKQFMKNFRNAIKVGVNGAGNEKHFDSALGFLAANGTSFLRKDSHLTILFLSDLDSKDASVVSPKKFAASLLRHRDAEHLQLFGLLSTDHRTNFDELNSKKLLPIEILDLHPKSDQGDELADHLKMIGTSMAAPSTMEVKIPLEGTPTQNNFEVYLNGAPTKPSSPVKYDAATHTVTFFLLVSEESSVEVRYPGTCQ